MTKSLKRQHYLVQHDLVSLEGLPKFIWRAVERDSSGGLRQLNEGDQWIAYAYIDNQNDRNPRSLITGFYECTKRCWRGAVPLAPEKLVEMGCKNDQEAWMVEGKDYGSSVFRCKVLKNMRAVYLPETAPSNTFD